MDSTDLQESSISVLLLCVPAAEIHSSIYTGDYCL